MAIAPIHPEGPEIDSVIVPVTPEGIVIEAVLSPVTPVGLQFSAEAVAAGGPQSRVRSFLARWWFGREGSS